MAGYLDLLKKLKGAPVVEDLAKAAGVPSSLLNLFSPGQDVSAFMPKETPKETLEDDKQYSDGSSLYYPHDLFANQTAAYIYFMVRDSQGSTASMYKDGTTNTTDAAKLFKRLALYMPPSIKVNYGTKWEEVSLTVSRNMDMIGNFASGVASSGAGVIGGIANTLKSQGAQNAILAGMAADKAMGTQAFQNEAEFRSKSILDPQAALLFKGVEFREFQFDFQLLARTKQESEDIRQIIKTFKWAMHPAKGSGETWQYPCFFEIYLLTPTRKYMFNIMNSALIRMDVDYGGSGIPSFFRENGAPVDIRMSLTFKELQVLTKEMILKDY